MSNNVLRLKRAVYFFLKELKSDPNRRPFMGEKYVCPVCNTHLAYFNPIDFGLLEDLDKHQYIYPMFSGETANLLKYECPACRAHDRDRLYALYIKKAFDKLDKTKKYNFLDIAPSSLRMYLKNQPFLNYRSADLFMKGVDDVVDITKMDIYENGRFDFFLCSHVLEHVPDEKAAISELYRVLKPGGWGIAMVPIVTTIEDTVEDPKIASDADRWKYYGQNDHVRQYSSKGWVKSLEAGGFKVHRLGIDYFGKEVFEKNGIHPRSILYIAEKL